MTKTSLELLRDIQADLEELRRTARELPPHLARRLEMFADRMEARAREIDQMA